MPQTFSKDPDAVLDYTVDWSSWLGSDTISTSTWTVPTGITKDSDTKTTTTATIWLSGGVIDQDYLPINHIVTAGLRTEDRSILIRVRTH